MTYGRRRREQAGAVGDLATASASLIKVCTGTEPGKVARSRAVPAIAFPRTSKWWTKSSDGSTEKRFESAVRGRMQSMIVDLFAGGGGASTGIARALGRSPDVAINHNATALAVHEANHPETRHFIESVWNVDPLEVTRGAHVDLLWASPDCRHFSRAKGAPLRDGKVRGLAWSAVRWAAATAPNVIVIENVEEFATWGPLIDGVPDPKRKGKTFRTFVRRLNRLGYHVDWRTLRASDFGAATSRKRLFVVARHARIGAPRWPVGDERTAQPASSAIDWTVEMPSVFERTTAYSQPTLARIVEGWRRFAGPYLIHRGNGERVGQSPRIYSLDRPLGTIVAQGIKHALVIPFIVKHYTRRGDGSNTCASINAPLGTITTKDHHAVAACFLDGAGRRDHRDDVAALLGREAVAVGVVDIGMRYLTPPELGRAQGFPPGYVLDRGADGRAVGATEQVKLIGNSVPPALAEAVVRANCEVL